jgi:hypothetical protein
MFRQAGIAISVAIIFSVASGALAAPVREASNNSPQHTSPDGTPNGPFFYADTYGVPAAVLRPAHQVRRPARKH